MQTQMTLSLGIDEKVDVLDLIVRGEVEREAPRARCAKPEPAWDCVLSDGTDCALKDMCAEVMGTDGFDDKAFRERIDHISVRDGTELTFYLADG